MSSVRNWWCLRRRRLVVGLTEDVANPFSKVALHAVEERAHRTPQRAGDAMVR
ncbi:MAG: hypothetical protein ACHQCH_04160 [Solirubrobacterales bacterium]